MQFNSIQFIIFFVITLFAYYIVPVKRRWIALLIMNYAFSACFSIKLTFIMLLVTVISYIGARILKKTKKKKLVLRNRCCIRIKCIACI